MIRNTPVVAPRMITYCLSGVGCIVAVVVAVAVVAAVVVAVAAGVGIAAAGDAWG